MSKGGGSAPKAPDPMTIAGADAAYNRVNQITPGGSITYGSLDAAGNFVPTTEHEIRDSRGRVTSTVPTQTVKQTESPYQEAYRLASEGGALDIQSQILGGIPTTAGRARISDFSGDEMQNAMYNKAMSLMQPNIDQQYARTEQSLADRGLPITSKAYGQVMDRLDDSTNNAIQRVAWDAIGAGNQEQTRQFQLADQQRRNDLNEYAQLFGKAMLPTSTMGGQVGTSPIDIQGAFNTKYQGDLANYQQQQQASQGMWGNIMNLGGSLGAMALMSSKKFKTDKKAAPKVLDAMKKVPSEQWQYKHIPDEPPRIGPYAEDFGKAFGGDPNAQTIDVGRMTGVTFTAVKELAEKVERLEKMAA